VSTPTRRTVKKHHFVEFIQFGLVGGSGFVVNMVAFIVLSKVFTGDDPARAHEVLFPLFLFDKNFRVYHLLSTIAFVIANIWNFELNRAWTFRKGGKSSRRRFSRYFLVGAAAQVVGLVIMSFLLHPASPIALPRDVFDDSSGFRNAKYWAQLIQIIATMPVSFVLQKLWTFAAHETPDDAPSPGGPVGPRRVGTTR
jgi:putative flippase GtrA